MRRFLAAVLVGALVAPAAAQAGRDQEARAVARVLWRDPGAIASRDLLWGPGSPEGAPRPPFTFLREDTSGTKAKVDVVDANGAEWSVKFTKTSTKGSEVHAEIAAARLMWALGYPVEEHYYVPDGRIEGATDLERAAEAIAPGGRFSTARFEKRAADVVRVGRWDFDDNPFEDTREFSGLKVLVMLLANWDARDDNTAILRMPAATGDTEVYIISDTGTAFGRFGGGLLHRPSRWNLAHYVRQKFVRRVTATSVDFHDRPIGWKDVSVPLDHARWFSSMAAQLTPEQVRRAFEAAGGTPAEVEGFSNAVIARIGELKAAVGDR